MSMFGTNERTARDMLHEVALKCPVRSVFERKRVQDSKQGFAGGYTSGKARV